jgi:glycosyltransferase involved in cell wall biosynthesis
VHVHSAYNLRYVYLASRLFFLKKSIFFHEHFGDININASVRWHQKWIYPNVFFIAVSRQLGAWAISAIKLSPQRVFLLQNTIIKQQTMNAVLSSPPYQLLLVANIRRTKNIEFAIELLNALKTPVAAYNLTIIGQINDAVYYEELQQLIAGKRLAQYINFIYHCNNIQSILNNYHLALHTAKSETGPLVLIEYIAQGLPFITYNTGEVAARLQPYLPQFIMHDFDIEKWVQAIVEIIALQREKVAAEFNTLYQQYYSPESYYKQCITIYDKGFQKEP